MVSGAGGVSGGGDSFKPLSHDAYEKLTPAEKGWYNSQLYQHNAQQIEDAKGVKWQKGQLHNLKNWLLDAAKKEGKSPEFAKKMYNNFIKAFEEECIRSMQHAAAQAKRIEQDYKREG